jgi:UDPglucose--hexose-1-phosphate uridylyltransferase
MHLEICLPHRGAGKLEYLAGSETFGGAFLTDVAPEVAAARLREACAGVEVPG